LRLKSSFLNGRGLFLAVGIGACPVVFFTGVFSSGLSFFFKVLEIVGFVSEFLKFPLFIINQLILWNRLIKLFQNSEKISTKLKLELTSKMLIDDRKTK